MEGMRLVQLCGNIRDTSLINHTGCMHKTCRGATGKLANYVLVKWKRVCMEGKSQNEPLCILQACPFKVTQ